MYILLIKLAFRSLLRQWRRNLFSSAMIGVGFASLVLVAAHRYRCDIHMQTTAAYLNYKGQISIYIKDGYSKHLTSPEKFQITQKQQADILTILADISGIEYVGKYLILPGLLSNGCNSTPIIVTGIDMSIDEEITNHKMVKKWTPVLYASKGGKSLSINVPESITPLLITENVAKSLKKEASVIYPDFSIESPQILDCESDEHKVALSKDSYLQLLLRDNFGDINVVDTNFVGKFQTGTIFLDDVSTYIALNTLQQAAGNFKITYIAVYLSDLSKIHMISTAINQKFADKNLPFEALLSKGKELNLLYDGFIKWLWSVEIFIYILLGFIILMTVFNFTAMAIVERKSEIGTLRALGFKPGLISQIFQIESFFLSVFSTLVGAAIAATTISIVNFLKIPYKPPGVPSTIHFKLAATYEIYAERALAVFALTIIVTFMVIIWHSYQDNISKLLRN